MTDCTRISCPTLSDYPQRHSVWQQIQNVPTNPVPETRPMLPGLPDHPDADCRSHFPESSSLLRAMTGSAPADSRPRLAYRKPNTKNRKPALCVSLRGFA